MQIFGNFMIGLGLEYSVALGTLLGLYRSDKVIPWTADNDIFIKDSKTAHTMMTLWGTQNASSTEFSLLFQGIPRLCINSQFAGGKIKKWTHNWGEMPGLAL